MYHIHIHTSDKEYQVCSIACCLDGWCCKLKFDSLCAHLCWIWPSQYCFWHSTSKASSVIAINIWIPVWNYLLGLLRNFNSRTYNMYQACIMRAFSVRLNLLFRSSATDYHRYLVHHIPTTAYIRVYGTMTTLALTLCERRKRTRHQGNR